MLRVKSPYFTPIRVEARLERLITDPGAVVFQKIAKRWALSAGCPEVFRPTLIERE